MELTVSKKGRKTKLSKKTNEELIDIILRKDDVEKKQQNLLEIAKTTIECDNISIDKLKSTIDNKEIIISDYECKISELEEHIGNLNNSLDSANGVNSSISTELFAAYKTIHKLKIINAIIIFIVFIFIIISYVIK